MIKLTLKRKLGANQIPAHLTTLSVSWLNNQFKALAVHRGTIIGTWERPGDTDGAGNFEGFIREAIQHTGYHGQTVTLLLAHPRLVQQLVDVPPVKGAALHKVIQRQAQQQKVFAGEAAWASQVSPPGKGLQRVVLHLFPRLLLNQLIQGCKRNGLHLTAVIPPSAVLHHQLSQLPLDQEEVAFLAAETAGSTSLVVGRSDGQIMLARTLQGTWNEEPERLALDLNRTILFANQQYPGSFTKGLWLFGAGAEDQGEPLQRNLQLPIHISPVFFESFYWATEALKLRPDLAPNLISPELQKAPQRKVFAKVVAACTGLVVIGALAASGYFIFQAQQEEQNIKALKAQMTKWENKREDLKALDKELTNKKTVVRVVLGERPPPIPAYMLAYLPEAVPSDLVVTNFQIQRQGEDGLYRMHLAGTLQQGEKRPNPPSPTDSITSLKGRLEGPPFHIKLIERDARPEKPGAQPAKAAGTNSSWFDRFDSLNSMAPSTPAVRNPVPVDHFEIDGVMR
jgi:hypothetical protein